MQINMFRHFKKIFICQLYGVKQTYVTKENVFILFLTQGCRAWIKIRDNLIIHSRKTFIRFFTA